MAKSPSVMVQKNHMVLGIVKILKEEKFIRDYKEVDGMMIPYSMETKSNGTVFFTRKIDTVEINSEIDDALFEMPEKESGE